MVGRELSEKETQRKCRINRIGTLAVFLLSFNRFLATPLARLPLSPLVRHAIVNNKDAPLVRPSVRHAIVNDKEAPLVCPLVRHAVVNHKDSLLVSPLVRHAVVNDKGALLVRWSVMLSQATKTHR